METIIRSVILSFLLAAGCTLFFEALLPKRSFSALWLRFLRFPAFMAGLLLISFTPIPPFIFQPVRFVLVIMAAALIFFDVTFVRSLVFSLLLCSIYWIISSLLVSAMYLFPPALHRSLNDAAEYIIHSIFLCLMLIFYHRFKNRSRQWPVKSRIFAGFFSVVSLIVILSIIMINESGTAAENHARLAALSGFAVINVCSFYFISKAMDREEEMQRLRLLQEKTQNQMLLYQGMQKSYDLQRRQLHDYKNQLGCIQGMLENGQMQNALSYISRLTGTLSQSSSLINTGHEVVNIILNRKYQEASDKGITMTLAINDLSGLCISEEEIVILLGNLLDNAISACEKLDSGRIIKFKMTMENGQLILSVRNPVKEPVLIKDNRVVTGRQRGSRHGMGLLNVDSVIRAHGGTSVLKYDNGWFYFSAIIP